MEKTRVSKGENYWCIDRGLDVGANTDVNNYFDEVMFRVGNYFHTKEEAESVARKLRAVLKGADVIEMPSEEEIEDAMKTSVTESIMCVAPYESFTPKATDLLECAWLKGAEWVKSKIVK